MKRITLYCFCISILLTGQLFGQNEKLIDSLEQLIPGMHDSAKVQALCELSAKYRIIDSQKSYHLLNESIYIASKINRPGLLKSAYTSAVRIHYKNGNIDSSLVYSHLLYNLVSNQNDSFEIAQASNNLGVLYKIVGDYEKAIRYYQQSLDIKKAMNNQLGIAKSYNNLGLVYNQMGSYERALAYYLKSLKIKRQLDNENSLAASLVNIGLVYEKLSMDSLAFNAQNEALEIYSKRNYLKGMATASINLGELLYKKGDIEKAYKYFQKALTLNDSIKNTSGLAYAYNSLGLVLSDKNKFEEAIQMHKLAIEHIISVGDPYALASFYLDLGRTYLLAKETKLSEQYLGKALQIAQKQKLMSLKYEAILSLSKVKSEQRKYYAAFELLERGHALKDSIFSDESKRAIVNLQILHSVDEQENKIENLKEANDLQEEKLKQNKYLTWSLVLNLLAFLVLIIVVFVRYRHLSKLNKKLHQQQSELKTKNEFLNSLLNTIPTPILYKDKDLRVLGCNSFYEEMVGMPEKELIGKTLEELNYTNESDLHNQADRRVLDDPSIYSYETKIAFADNTMHDVIIHKSSFRDENNKVAGVLAIIIDISEQKENEKRLLKNERSLAILNELHKDLEGSYEMLIEKSQQRLCEYSSANYSFYIFWPSANNDQSEIYLLNSNSHKFEQIRVGNISEKYPKIDSIKHEGSPILISKNDDEINEYSKLLHISASKLSELLLFPIHEGKQSPGMIGIANFDHDGSHTKDANISLFVSDIWGLLQRKRSLLDLQQSELNLKESNAAINKFFSIIAHDLKNPFNAILGFAQLLSDFYNEFSEKEKLQYIKNLHEASEATYRLLENLLQWSFTQTGKVEYKPEEIDLSVFANECAMLAKPSCDKKDIRINIKIPFNSTVYADANMVKTIFRNLVSNAIKFSNRGSIIKLGIKNHGQFRIVHVIDEGIGIEPDMVEKLFSLGEKVKMEGTEEEKGTGLGLLLCKEFVEMNGGEITVESKPGKGSTFSFSLPCCHD